MPTANHPSASFHRKPLSHAILIACLSLGATALSAPLSLAQAQTQSSALHSFNIPAGNLETALQQFAAQSGISLAYSPERVQGRQSAGVQGQYSTASALQSLLAGSGLYASAQSNGSYRLELAQASLDSTALPTTVIYGGRLKPDEVGHNNVYNENVTSVYQGREELQRFQVTNPGDVFKGMNGVYSMDTRSSQAITPNIRGITGEGRVPLTIDGTEQSTNVWMHAFGVGNRSYADPALFRSIEVEKGPSLSRGIKSGVGGGVNIRTIEADDIIPEGDSWGVEANLRTSSNTKKSGQDPLSVYGKDWQDVSGAKISSDGRTLIVPTDKPRTNGSGKLNLDDHAEVLSIAARNKFTDILLSRSERTSGNYYAGKRNASKYSGHNPYNQKSTDALIPNLVKLYEPGSEVFNTASETETTLIKNNWYLPNEQKIGLQFMRTDTTFGETTPGTSVLAWGYLEAADKSNPNRDRSGDRFVYELPHSELRLDSYKINYEANPVDNDWLDLETSLWKTKTTATRYQSGASPYTLDIDDTTANRLSFWSQMVEHGFWPSDSPPSDFSGLIDFDGTIYSNGKQWTAHDRTGFDFSNLMLLSDRLQLTLGGSYQTEKLDERVELSKTVTNGFAPDGTLLNMQTDRMGPRAGERKEYSAMMNLSWQATDWLNLTAGTRYMHYKGKDTGTAKRRRQQDEFYKATQRKTGVELTWYEPLSAEEYKARAEIANAAYDWANGGAFERMALLNEFDNGREYAIGGAGRYNGTRYSSWRKTAFVPYKNGKLDSSKNPFVNGEIPQSSLYDGAIEAMDDLGNTAYIPRVLPAGYYGSEVYESLDASQGWEAPEEQSGDSFSPVLSATARITPFGTGFIRYAQTTRFPSVYELTGTAIVDGNGAVGSLANGVRKPERSINWEIGYAHDLRQFFPSFHQADIRVSYYNTQISNFIDRARVYDLVQYDKKKTSGLELQSRFDSGNYFGSLGLTYRLKQKLCDKDYASELDPIYNRIPSCVTGGFPGTYSGSSLQPKYSINSLLGTRLFNDKLEIGWRSTYHKGAENKQLDKLLASTKGPEKWPISSIYFPDGGISQFYYQSVLLHDIYVNFNATENLKFNLAANNITNEYYLDPMSKNLLPGPGRTVTAGININF